MRRRHILFLVLGVCLLGAAPPPHFAYLGVNNSASETGSGPGAIYRNVWIANKARPAALGSATTPLM